MKNSTVCNVLGAALLIMFAGHDAPGQSQSAPNAGVPQQDRVLQELLGEVRQLRIALQQISDIRSSLATAEVKLEEAEKGQDTGVVSPSVTVRYREALEGLRRQEQTRTQRELQVTAQLETERTNLTELYKRLDALELEMVTSQRDDKPKRDKPKK